MRHAGPCIDGCSCLARGRLDCDARSGHVQLSIRSPRSLAPAFEDLDPGQTHGFETPRQSANTDMIEIRVAN